MDIFSTIKTRRSVRLFDEKPVDKETIEKIIEAATFAPSACNVQGWRFVVVDDQKIKERIVDLGGSINIKKAPVGILVLYDNRTKNSEYADHIQSAAAATQNLLLAAHALGLGACWLCHLPTHRQLRNLLNIPKALSPVAYVLLGYKKNEPSAMPRKHTPEQITSFNTFSSPAPLEKSSRLNLFISKTLIKIYSLTPAFVKAKWLNQYLDKKFVKKFTN